MMNIEELPPNKPNFPLIVVLFCATILLVLILALFFVHSEGGHLVFRHHSSHPTSQLRLSGTREGQLPV